MFGLAKVSGGGSWLGALPGKSSPLFGWGRQHQNTTTASDCAVPLQNRAVSTATHTPNIRVVPSDAKQSQPAGVGPTFGATVSAQATMSHRISNPIFNPDSFLRNSSLGSWAYLNNDVVNLDFTLPERGESLALRPRTPAPDSPTRSPPASLASFNNVGNRKGSVMSGRSSLERELDQVFNAWREQFVNKTEQEDEVDEEPEPFTPELAAKPLRTIMAEIRASPTPADKFTVAHHYAISRYQFAEPLTNLEYDALYSQVPWGDLPLSDLDLAFDVPGTDRATLLEFVMRRVDREDGAAIVTAFTPDVFVEVVEHALYGRSSLLRWSPLEAVCAISSYIRNRPTLDEAMVAKLWGYVRLSEMSLDDLDAAVAWGVPSRHAWEVARARMARFVGWRLFSAKRNKFRWKMAQPTRQTKVQWENEVDVLYFTPTL